MANAAFLFPHAPRTNPTPPPCSFALFFASYNLLGALSGEKGVRLSQPEISFVAFSGLRGGINLILAQVRCLEMRV
eukprot:354014-Chlamydomonas_euryale.AAC.3